jgi:hypothetical protein
MSSAEITALGDRSREWVDQECHYTSVIPRYLEVHEEVLRSR